MTHSTIVGGSTAKRVINCPASVNMAKALPPKPSSSYAEEGTRLHELIAAWLEDRIDTNALKADAAYEDKLRPALLAMDELDPLNEGIFVVEAKVEMPDIPGVFGSCDLLMKMGRTAVVLDWKFGDGIPVEAEGNEQLLFYATAALDTEATRWVFDNVDEVKLVIVQPPGMKVWALDADEFHERVGAFRWSLRQAVRRIDDPHAPMASGDWCKWCPAKPTCPLMTGAVDRVLRTSLESLPREQIGKYLAEADVLEDWIRDLRALALQSLENGVSVPGYKLVAKRGQRKWVDESKARAALLEHLDESDITVTELVSPAVAEKLLKKQKLSLPEGTVVSVSSGSTLAPEGDPRPAIVQIGAQISAALSKLS